MHLLKLNFISILAGLTFPSYPSFHGSGHYLHRRYDYLSSQMNTI